METKGRPVVRTRTKQPATKAPKEKMLVCIAYTTAEEYDLEGLETMLVCIAYTTAEEYDLEGLETMLVCIAYTTAEEYDLEGLEIDIRRLDIFRVMKMPQDAFDVIHVRHDPEPRSDGAQVDRQSTQGDIFFFRDGMVVFWNVEDQTMRDVRQMLEQYERNPYNIALVEWENEQMNYSYTENSTLLSNGDIQLSSSAAEMDMILEKYTFSNAMGLSVKLAIWEAWLDDYVDSIMYIPELLREGKRLKMSRPKVMQKIGELFALKYRINLGSDLLITPDFYWDREHLEGLYLKTCRFLNIPGRTKMSKRNRHDRGSSSSADERSSSSPKCPPPPAKTSRMATGGSEATVTMNALPSELQSLAKLILEQTKQQQEAVGDRLSDQIKILDGKVDSLSTELTAVRERVGSLEAAADWNNTEIERLQRELQQEKRERIKSDLLAERYSRKPDIIVRGLPYRREENCVLLFNDFVSGELGLDPVGLVAVHRLSQPTKTRPNPPLLARLINLHDRDRVLREGRRLRGTGLAVHEHLPPPLQAARAKLVPDRDAATTKARENSTVVNEKLRHCQELAELMRTHLSERHSLRLEWMIIALIAIEVLFEVVRIFTRTFTEADSVKEQK
ncbi:RMND1 [Branchiostoma lanceolatum]|uniref:RMND1 protein n=1 Tax=Branchiostoma lanceolatum TaxID=7740 RepID=A0A8J9VA55_BRALA|nr:RMND1 [Branchiostoma lanceolatum]